jgi:hypothetical protein
VLGRLHAERVQRLRDPVGREPSVTVRHQRFPPARGLVALDVLRGKVSVEAARDEYGVVVDDAEATRALRERPRGEPPFFDRGPGYERLARG